MGENCQGIVGIVISIAVFQMGENCVDKFSQLDYLYLTSMGFDNHQDCQIFRNY